MLTDQKIDRLASTGHGKRRILAIADECDGPILAVERTVLGYWHVSVSVPCAGARLAQGGGSTFAQAVSACEEDAVRMRELLAWAGAQAHATEAVNAAVAVLRHIEGAR